MAYQGHIVVPTTHEKTEKVLDKLKAKMVTTFGGYSEYNGSGGWEGESGVATEDHVRLVVNTTEMNREDFLLYLNTEAIYVKQMLEEEAVLIEVHEIDMNLV